MEFKIFIYNLKIYRLFSTSLDKLIRGKKEIYKNFGDWDYGYFQNFYKSDFYGEITIFGPSEAYVGKISIKIPNF